MCKKQLEQQQDNSHTRCWSAKKIAKTWQGSQEKIKVVKSTTGIKPADATDYYTVISCGLFMMLYKAVLYFNYLSV